MSTEDIDIILKNFGVGQRKMNDPFFEDIYKNCKVFERKGVIIEDETELSLNELKEFSCNACQATFQSLMDFELHYHDIHRFVCAQCKKWRPTARLLEIHVQENHDSFFKVLAEKKPMYQCFLSECDVKFSNPFERREHCILIHEFPKNYRFDEYLHVKKDDQKNDSAMETDDSLTSKNNSKIFLCKNKKQKTFSKASVSTKNMVEKKDNSSDKNIESKKSTVTMFVPRQVQQKSFAKVLSKNENLVKNNSKFQNMMDLAESLPDT